MKKFWETLWKREGEFFRSNGGEFRNGTSFIAVSSLAEQYYCEYKLENESILGEIPTETKKSGTAIHDELMPIEEVTREEFVSLVEEKGPTLAVLGLWGTVGKLKVVGIPDHIVWSGGRPLWLIELKTTKGNPTQLWEDQENQARIYGLLLDRMGFDCSVMHMAVVRLRSSELDEREKEEWIERVSDALMGGRIVELESQYRGKMKVHVIDHDLKRAEAAVLSRAGYWLNEREPTSSASVGKCRACEYDSICTKSLHGR